jgi:hypothetical protein
LHFLSYLHAQNGNGNGHLQAIELQSFEAGLKFSLRYDELASEDVFGITTTTKDLNLREGIYTKAEGSLVHANFLSFLLDGTVQWEQHFQETDQDSNTTRGIWYEGRANVDILQEKPYSAHAFWQKSRTDYDYPFSRSRTVISEIFGARLDWNNERAPTTIFFEHLTSDSDVNFEDKKRISYGGNVKLPSDAGETKASIEYDEIKEYEQEYTKLAADVDARYDLTADIESTTYFQYLKWGRDREETNLRGSQRFLYNYTDKINFFCQLAGFRNDFRDDIYRFCSGQLGYYWGIYDNFATTGSMQVSASDSKDYFFYQYGPTWALSYYRNTDLGRFSLNYSINFRQDVSEAADKPSRVVDEAHVYTLGTPIELLQLNVDTTTIVVRDDTGSITYAEGPDYNIVTNNDTTSLNIPLASAILPNSTIKISYNFQPQGYKAKVTQQQVDVGWEYSHFSAGYTFSDLAYFDVHGDNPTLFESRRHQVFVRYVDEYLDSKVQFDSVRRNNSPYDQITFLQGISYSFTPIDMKFQGEYYHTEFQLSDRQQDGLQLLYTARSTPLRGLLLEARASYLYEKFDVTKTGYGAGLRAEYKFRGWNFRAEYRFLQEKLDDNTQTYHNALVEIERKF